MIRREDLFGVGFGRRFFLVFLTLLGLLLLSVGVAVEFGAWLGLGVFVWGVTQWSIPF